MIDVLFLDGTGAPLGGSLQASTFAEALDPQRFRFRLVPYPADYGRAVSYVQSVEIGQHALVEAIRATPNRVVVGGYSQGAYIAGNLAADVHAYDDLVDLEIAACALLADPARPAGHYIGATDPGGYGISGRRIVDGAIWAAAPGDPITALPEGNPLRSVADLTGYFSIASPEDMLIWGAETLDAVRRGRLQDWWRPWLWRDWAGALRYAKGYLVDGKHTDAYLTSGLCVALAQAVNDSVS